MHAVYIVDIAKCTLKFVCPSLFDEPQFVGLFLPANLPITSKEGLEQGKNRTHTAG